jgi:triacylglycerol esterase/lipase EstA (alpha/beta hydrolase family)
MANFFQDAITATGAYLFIWFAIQWVERKNSELLEAVVPGLLVLGYVGWGSTTITGLWPWIVGVGLAAWGMVRVRAL